MSSKKTSIRTKEELLHLLDTQDLIGLRKSLDLTPLETPTVKNADLKEKLSQLSYTYLLTTVIQLKSDTIEMLGDILRFLTRQQTAVRTTGCFLSLDQNIKLKPQLIETVTTWSHRKSAGNEEKSWNDILQTFLHQIRPLLNNLLDAGRPNEEEDSFKDRMTDPHSRLEFLLDIRKGQNPDINNRHTVRYDKKKDESFLHLKSKINEKTKTFSQELARWKKIIRSAGKTIPKTSSIPRLYQQSREKWLQFRETILFKGRIAESEALFEIYRYDLFRHRPQLYEIWILCTLLESFQRSDFEINPTTKIENFLFYQLHRKRTADLNTPIFIPAGHPTATRRTLRQTQSIINHDKIVCTILPKSPPRRQRHQQPDSRQQLGTTPQRAKDILLRKRRQNRRRRQTIPPKNSSPKNSKTSNAAISTSRSWTWTSNTS